MFIVIFAGVTHWTMGMLYWIYCIVALMVMVRVVLNNRDAVKTLAWILVLLFLPVLGLLLYFFFGRDTRKERMIGRRMLTQIQQRRQLNDDADNQADVPQGYEPLVNYLRNSSSACLVGASDVCVFRSTKEFAKALYDEIDAAKEHIHIQFYIIEDDGFGVLLREHLMAKAREGVEVRVIYDSVGCWKVGKEFFETMRCAGVYVESFMKVRFPLLTNRVNYRNHRKVVVIDGKVGFVGGCNVADRYLKGVEWGDWRDTMMMLRGTAVHGLQSSFLVDWYFANRTLVCGKRYFPQLPSGNEALVQVVQSNPVGEVRSAMVGMIKALSMARNYVYLQTPYFMPGGAFLLALKSAAMSGADVRLMIPERSDNRVMDYASRSYLVDIMKAGVKVYLYNQGFLHSKTMVCDDNLSSVGSMNLDFRSFYYNFEVSAFVYSRKVACALKEKFLDEARCCRQLSLSTFAKRSLKERCLESVARLLSPLL